MKKFNSLLIISLVFIIFSTSLGVSQIQSLEPIRLGDDVNLIQLCANCTFNNITSVLFPNSTQSLGEVVMTKTGTSYNFTLSSANTPVTGTYIVNGVGDEDGIDTIWNYDFEVTNFGTTITNSGVVYGVLLIIIFAMDVLFFFLIWTLSPENHRNEEGDFIGISIKKYIRAVLIGISYGLILLTLNLMNAVANTTSAISQFAGILGGIFLIMMGAAWIWTLLIVIWIAMMMWSDGNLIKEIQKRFDDIESGVGGFQI